MIKSKLYRYIGKNGILTTPIQLEGVAYTELYHLTASPGKILTDGRVYSKWMDIEIEDMENWYEIDIPATMIEGNNI